MFIKDFWKKKARVVTEQPKGLISVLLDITAEFGDRDDAAMDLSDYDEPEAEEALSKVALDESTDTHLAERCSESLAEIWCRKERVNMDVLGKLRGNALHMAISLIQVKKPEWKSYVESAISDNDP